MLPNRLIPLTISALSMIVFSGCTANMHSIFRSFPLSGNQQGNQSISVDAKQRLVLSGQRNGQLVVCAEPSPDALSVIGSSMAAGGYTPSQISVELAAASSENATNIGLRTQTIQLLRDAMYRLCEGYFIGALDGDGYERLQRRYQNGMIGLLAIEQLTGAVMPRQVVLKTASVAESSNGLMETQKNVDEAKRAVQQIHEELTKSIERKKKVDAEVRDKESLAKKDKEAAASPDADDAAKLKAKQSADELTKSQKRQDQLVEDIKEHEEAIKDAQDNLKAEEYLRDTARGVHTESTGSAQFASSLNGGSNINKDTVKALGKAVENIVVKVVDASYSEESCLQFQLARADETDTKAVRLLNNRLGQSVIDFCEKILKLKGEQAEKSAIMMGSEASEALDPKLKQQSLKIQELKNELKEEYLLKDIKKLKDANKQ